MATNWDKKRSDWYCRAIEQSNYPKKAVTVLLPLLKKCESVIDIGAGCGALSIPIAGSVKQVTALEPSKWMYALLLKKVREAGIRNIRACNSGWKKSGIQGGRHLTLRPHDMVLCANLPHSVVCDKKFIQYITKISKKYIVYFHGAGRWNRFYYDDLYPLLLKRKYINEGDYLKTYALLHQHGIFANIKLFTFRLDQPFEDFNDAMDFWRHRLKTNLTSGKEKMLADFLKKKLIPLKRGNALLAPFGLRRSAVLWWET